MKNNGRGLIIPQGAAQAAAMEQINRMTGAPKKVAIFKMPVCDCGGELQTNPMLEGLWYCPACNHRVDVVSPEGKRWMTAIVLSTMASSKAIMQQRLHEMFSGLFQGW